MAEVARRDQWSGSLGFVLAAAGSAIGLGNVWKFPYITGLNGGGAFVLIYLGCILVVGIPVMMCEFTLGRRTGQSPVGAFRALSSRSARNTATGRWLGWLILFTAAALACFGSYGAAVLTLIAGICALYYKWVSVGIVSVFSAATILGYYSVVGGWTIDYTVLAVTQQMEAQTAEQISALFQTIASSPAWSVAGMFCFVLFSAAVVFFGVRNGIERTSKVLMPLLLIMLFLLILRGLTLPGSEKGVQFLLAPDFSKITKEGILIALGHAFFTLSLGMGISITYGSYLDKKRNIFGATLAVVCLDTLIALMAGLAIFPALFALEMDPSSGPGLVFQVMPVAFNAMPDNLGWLWCTIFFALLAIAAVTSGISLLEVVVACCCEELKISRRKATVLCVILVGLIGMLCAFSSVSWDALPWLQSWLEMVFHTSQASFFDLLDVFNTYYLLPISGCGICIFVGWIWGSRHAVQELRHGGRSFTDVGIWQLLSGIKNNQPGQITMAMIWGALIRFVTPVAIFFLFLNGIGWF